MEGGSVKYSFTFGIAIVAGEMEVERALDPEESPSLDWIAELALKQLHKGSGHITRLVIEEVPTVPYAPPADKVWGPEEFGRPAP